MKESERFDYNLSNWILVQAILERVSGQPYAQLAQRLVFKPLRMADSGIAAGEAGTIPNLALGGRVRHMGTEGRDAQDLASNDGTCGAYRTISWRGLGNGRTVLFLSSLRPPDEKLFAFAETLLSTPPPKP